MYRIYKTTSFESAHKLIGHPQCGKLHGHSYKAEVWIECDDLAKPYGFVLDFHEISGYFKQFDHSGQILSESAEKIAENAARFFSERLGAIYNNQQVRFFVKVRIWETATGYAEYEL
jgi:6-pyruvoyl-tetrahydropterin synthase